MGLVGRVEGEGMRMRGRLWGPVVHVPLGGSTDLQKSIAEKRVAADAAQKTLDNKKARERLAEKNKN
jgi:hypothetical protein